ncbi:MAG: N-acetylglucosamine-6-phosphate deacetylase [Oscillibacter sp.]|nr:N-acetylglucosamine-6-phosphate deacetylase [Oscillibacter sp.]
MIIKNAKVYTPEHRFQVQDLTIRNGRIVSDADPLENEEIIDATGLTALPGLVDIHFHGAVGHDFCDADEAGLQAIADFEASRGILAICPATMTFSEEILNGIADVAAAHKNEKGADLVGINMEGPYISPKRIGAQNPKYVQGADVEMFRRLQKRSNGLFKLVDIAPEEPGNMEFIKACHDEVRISLAHTCTDYDTAKEAFASGASHMTHLYNAMFGINHRDPGPIIAALEDGAEVELITDGVHIHPAMVRFTFHTFGDDKVILIADSMEAAGLPDGQYQLGGQAVTVTGPRAVLTEHPDTIAGSATCLFDCMKRAVLDMGIPLESAVRAASENPAKSIGVDADYGSLAEGRYGNVILVDDALNIKSVIQKGVVL